MENTYREGQAGAPEEFTRPTATYKRKALIALAGLGLFMIFYLVLAGWFSLAAYRLITGAMYATNGFGPFLAGLCTAFFAVFMIKALFLGKQAARRNDLEVTPAQQPRLFEFLYRLADEAGAPRPHKVFLSPRVNAAVFYELSVLNLFYPSRKNLEIGLGLVNVLTLSEFKAVCAHEFGHFAQRSMAVGRWVYTAQQIAGKIVTKRDALDGFLDGLSRIDIRVAWIGWIMKVIVWSIRAVVELLFRGVVLAQRALSREMEMQADLVAVSLTGSDTLIHALHRLGAADDAWDRAMRFAAAEAKDKRIVGDVFAVQSRIIEHLSLILGDPLYGKYPPLPTENPQAHRVFKADFALPPTMWATHPLNFERENNAKRHYVPSVVDERSAWSIFDDAESLRKDVSLRLAGNDEETPAPLETSLDKLEQSYRREYFNRAYRGIYLGRPMSLQYERFEELYDDQLQASAADLQKLYPESLAQDLERLRNLEKELALLESLQAKTFVPADGVIRHRGRQLRRGELPAAVDTAQAELREARAAFNEHDRLCRSLHLALAREMGHGWEPYLKQLISMLHYAEHSIARLEEGRLVLRKVFAIEAAGRARIGKNAVYRILYAAEDMYKSMAMVYTRAESVVFDPSFVKHFGAASFTEGLGSLEFVPPTAENLGNWLNVAENWVGHTLQVLQRLSACTLDRLLESEAAVAAWARSGAIAEEAPAPVSLPAARDTFVAGGERLRDIQPGAWQRFQSAQGWRAGLLRLGVAGTIMGAVLFTGVSLAKLDLSIYNGLGRTVRVDVDGNSVSIPAYSSAKLDVENHAHYKIETRDDKGRLLEAFESDAGNKDGMFYNVMAAAPLVKWSATYGSVTAPPQENLGVPRWGNVNADVIFAEPPHSISTQKGGPQGGLRTVLSGAGGVAPMDMLRLVPPEAIGQVLQTQARWDDPHDPNLIAWLNMLKGGADDKNILMQRRADNPNDIASVRYLQDLTTGQEHERLCADIRQRSEAEPDNPDMRYLAIRCMSDPDAKTRAFDQGQQRWPTHGWFAYAAGYTAEEKGDLTATTRLMSVAAQNEPILRDMVNVDLARLKRLRSHDPSADVGQLARDSRSLRTLLAIDAGREMGDGPMLAYHQLALGHLEEAVARARGSQHEARVLRLAAASSGASNALMQRALALPAPQAELDADDTALFAAAALAIRADRDLVPYRGAFAKLARARFPDTMDDPMYRFAVALKERKIEDANKALKGLPLDLLGQAYAMARRCLAPALPSNGASARAACCFPMKDRISFKEERL